MSGTILKVGKSHENPRACACAMHILIRTNNKEINVLTQKVL